MFVLWLFISAFYCANANDAGYIVLASDRVNATIFYSCLKTEDQPLNISKSIALPAGVRLRGIAYDQVRDQVYWSDMTENKVFQMDMDGTNIEQIYSESYVNCMEIDSVYRQLYYFSKRESLMRVYNISNGDHRTLFTFPVQLVYDLQLDGRYGYVFFTSSDGIYRFRTNSSSTYEILILNDEPRGLGLDPTGVRLYWTDKGREIHSCDATDGGNINLLLKESSISELSNRPTDVISISQYIYVRLRNYDHLIRARLNGSFPSTDIEWGTFQTDSIYDRLSVVKLNPKISSRVCSDEITPSEDKNRTTTAFFKISVEIGRTCLSCKGRCTRCAMECTRALQCTSLRYDEKGCHLNPVRNGEQYVRV